MPLKQPSYVIWIHLTRSSVTWCQKNINCPLSLSIIDNVIIFFAINFHQLCFSSIFPVYFSILVKFKYNSSILERIFKFKYNSRFPDWVGTLCIKWFNWIHFQMNLLATFSFIQKIFFSKYGLAVYTSTCTSTKVLYSLFPGPPSTHVWLYENTIH